MCIATWKPSPASALPQVSGEAVAIYGWCRGVGRGGGRRQEDGMGQGKADPKMEWPREEVKPGFGT